ncbi:sigma-70 family RNA polymerase sigma factor [Paenibacillus profundus]|uniref:RNA polymerase sigma factor n=1 Tax=Paenibacillus profundus TaxID=1173085 RepID=A0ABS8YQJ4_9BACL|nr:MULTISPECIES: sigma-70 family RNA polymerase sigma factor [Paenibacillus]MCE5171864.1 sigma-70 family RNA polymerase sigma factor [Paenibacillus profundus]
MGQWLYLLQRNVMNADTDAQELVYHSFRELVYRDIYKLLRDHGLTEDVIQESFIKAIAKGPEVRHAPVMRTWIRRVARNTALDVIRKNRKHRQMITTEFFHNPAISILLPDTEPSIANLVEDKFRDNLLYQSIRELQSDYQMLLLLHYFEEKSYKEMSQELHLSEQVISQRLARARKKLRQQFMRKWS